ncbi:hypothetical protein ScPMuIL_002357 [Solemya velum]
MPPQHTADRMSNCVIELSVDFGQANEGMIVAVTDSSDHHLLFYEGNPTQSISGTKSFSYTSITPRIYSVAADYRNGEIFLPQHVPGNIKRVKNINIWLNSSEVSTTFHRGISNAVSQIAVDWIHSNVYWADTHFHWIVVQSYRTDDTSMYRTLMHGLQEPVGLAVDPTKGYIFWSNVGDNPTISRASLAGSDITDLAHAGITRPTGLTLDYTKELIFWVDDSRDTLECMKYNGEDRQMVRRINGQQIVSLAFYESTVFVTFYKLQRVIGISTTTGAMYKEFSTFGGNPTGITMFNAVVQPMVQDLCAGFGCDHICVKTPSGPQCLCKNGYNLQSDKKSCQEDTGTWKQEVVFGIGSQICIANIRLLASSDSWVYNCPISVNSDIEGLEADMNDHIIFYYIQQTIYMYLLVEDVPEELVQITGSIGGMVYDWLDDIIYWTETTNGRIKMMSLANKNQAVIHTNLLSPGAIIADPHASVLFWISGTTSRTITRSDMDGGDERVIVSGLQINTPDLTFDATTDRIYWLNNGYIRSAKTDGTDVQLEIHVSNEGSLMSVYRDYFFWTENTGTTSTLRSGTISDNSVSYSKTFTGIITALTVYDSTNQPTNKVPLADNLLFLTDTTNGEIYQVSVTNGDVRAFDVENVGTVLGIAYHTQDDSIYWSDLNTGIWYASVGSAPATRQVYKLWTYYAKRVTIDETTDNLYYTAYSKSQTDGYIAVYNELKNMHRKIITNRKEPLAIQLDPPEGIMYWSEVGPGEVYKSNMDGSNTQSILSGLTWPNGLAIDKTAKTLYYMDGKDNTIGAIDLTNFGHRPISTDNTNAHLMDVIVSGGYLYYTAWNRNYVTRLDPNNPSDQNKIGENPEYGRLEGVYVVDGVKMPQNADCSERNGMCSGLCLPTSTGRTCACRDTVNLNSDKLTCETDNLCTGIPNGNLPPSCLRYEDEVCTFSCNTGYELATDTSVIHCEMGGNWNVSTGIFCKEKLCPDGVTNGRIESSCRRNIGSVCPYTCNSGYTADPDVGSISCMATSNWAQDLTKLCTETLCPRDFKNGAVTDCQRKIGNTCGVVCDTGYAASSDISLTCQASGNWNSDTSNICQAILCPSNIANGGLVNCGRMVGDTCSVECDTGYEDTSNVQLVCQSSGSWGRDTGAICQAILCPRTLNNGAVTSCQRRVGDVCSVTCETGYTDNASVSLTCLSSGDWNRDTSNICQEILCPRTINNGFVNCQRRIGDTCEITCDTGYVDKSSVILTCQSNGSWDRRTSNLCEPRACPLNFPNGVLSNGCTALFGEVCVFSCKEDYSMTLPTLTVSCLSSGDWSTQLSSVCQPKLCPDELANGSFECQRRIGTSCGYNCDQGYAANANVASVECISPGTWARELSDLCTLIRCSGAVPNGQLNTGCDLRVSSLCSYSCVAGYTRNADVTTITCLSSGAWSIDVSLLCKPVLCPSNIANGGLVNCERMVGDKCSVECDTGYDDTSNVQLVCQLSGSWDRDTGNICQAVLCPSNIANGRLVNCGRMVGDTCSVECDTGYEDTSNIQLVCQSSGSWDRETTAICQAILCPRMLNNGAVTSCQRRVGDVCSVTCETGYTDNASVSLVCLSSGVWHRDTSNICQEILCPRTINNGFVNCQRRIGDTCEITCDTGYVDKSKVNLTCQSNGNWDRVTSNLCEPRACPLNVPNGVLSNGCTAFFGEVCVFSCKEDYTMTPPTLTVSCLPSGDWSTQLSSVCQPKLCPEELANGSFECQRRIGTSCGYSCDQGYAANANVDSVECNSPGTWARELSDLCTLIRCSGVVPNGQLNTGCDLRVSSLCSYSCSAGYTRNAVVTTITCLSSGAWSIDVNSLCTKASANQKSTNERSTTTSKANCKRIPVEVPEGHKHCPTIPSTMLGETQWPCPSLEFERYICFTVSLCPSDIENGGLVNCERLVGDTCSVECDTGYEDTSNVQLVCQSSGSWDRDTGNICQEIRCDITTTKVHLLNGCQGRIGESCTFVCPEGYVSTTENIPRCLGTGEWSLNLAGLCEARMCSDSLPNGHLDDECDLSVSTECNYSCDTGYTKDASVSTLQCSSSGSWVPDVNNLCQLFLCPVLIPNGEVDGDCERVIGSDCGYHCSAGFSRDSKADFLRCVHPGNWDGDVDNICTAIHCPDTVQNVQLDDNCDASVGSICSFTCDIGYKKESSVTALTCLTSGSWSPDVTNLCHKKCEDGIQNGKVDGDCSNNAGHECAYTCDTGYRHQGDGKLICLNSGTWSIDVDLACEEIICPLSVPNGALSDGCAGKMGDVCYYTCVGDNMKNEEVTSLTCLSTALWSTAPTDLCLPPQPKESSSTGTIIGAGAGAGGFLLLLVIIVVVVVVIRRRRRNKDTDRNTTCGTENPVFQNCENDYMSLRNNRATYMELTKNIELEHEAADDYNAIPDLSVDIKVDNDYVTLNDDELADMKKAQFRRDLSSIYALPIPGVDTR